MCRPKMAIPAFAPLLARRIAMALALLAALALGLDEEACAARTLTQEGQWPALVEQVDLHEGLWLALAGQVSLHAVADQESSRSTPGKHRSAVPNPCHVCGTVMPMAGMIMATPVPIRACLTRVLVTEHRGLDPGGPLRPPRASLIA